MKISPSQTTVSKQSIEIYRKKDLKIKDVQLLQLA
jgi:hypothetical protein